MSAADVPPLDNAQLLLIQIYAVAALVRSMQNPGRAKPWSCLTSACAVPIRLSELIESKTSLPSTSSTASSSSMCTTSSRKSSHADALPMLLASTRNQPLPTRPNSDREASVTVWQAAKGYRSNRMHRRTPYCSPTATSNSFAQLALTADTFSAEDHVIDRIVGDSAQVQAPDDEAAIKCTRTIAGNCSLSDFETRHSDDQEDNWRSDEDNCSMSASASWHSDELDSVRTDCHSDNSELANVSSPSCSSAGPVSSVTSRPSSPPYSPPSSPLGSTSRHAQAISLETIIDEEVDAGGRFGDSRVSSPPSSPPSSPREAVGSSMSRERQGGSVSSPPSSPPSSPREAVGSSSPSSTLSSLSTPRRCKVRLAMSPSQVEALVDVRVDWAVKYSGKTILDTVEPQLTAFARTLLRISNEVQVLHDKTIVQARINADAQLIHEKLETSLHDLGSQNRAQFDELYADMLAHSRMHFGISSFNSHADRSCKFNSRFESSSSIPCKFFQRGRCRAGNMCEFSHDFEVSSDSDAESVFDRTFQSDLSSC